MGSFWEKIVVTGEFSSPPFHCLAFHCLAGILIGLVINYCDSIVKNLALSCAIILTAVIDFFCFAGGETEHVLVPGDFCMRA